MVHHDLHQAARSPNSANSNVELSSLSLLGNSVPDLRFKDRVRPGYPQRDVQIAMINRPDFSLDFDFPQYLTAITKPCHTF